MLPVTNSEQGVGRRWEQIRRARGLTLREVEEQSRELVAEFQDKRFLLCKGRVSTIEADATPNIYRLYALCTIYRLSIVDVLGWYGLPVSTRRKPLFLYAETDRKYHRRV